MKGESIMATIKVKCFSRRFEVNSIGNDFKEFDKDLVAYNAALLAVIGVCDDIHFCCSERIGATVVIAPQYIHGECIKLVKLVKAIRNYKADAFSDIITSPLQYMRAVGGHFYKTDKERAYIAEKYDALDQLIVKTRMIAVSYISSVFNEGVVSVSNEDNDKIVYIPQGDLVALIGVNEDELFQGVKLICENHEVSLEAQDLRDTSTDMMIIAGITSSDDDDDRELILTSSVTKGLVTAMLID
jgi:hypothetical protein